MAFKILPVVKAPYRVFVGQKFDVSGSWWGKSCAKGDAAVTEVDEARSDKKLFKVRAEPWGKQSAHAHPRAHLNEALEPASAPIF